MSGSMRFSALGGLRSPSQWARLLRTVRHLKPRQLAYGIRYRLAPPGSSRPWPLSAVPMRRQVPRMLAPSRPMLDAEGGITFQNRREDFAGAWTRSDLPRLWQYHLHYMGWLCELGTGQEEWIRRWIRENPPASAGAGWEPYQLSMRLMHWCGHFASLGQAPPPDILASMAVQAVRLRDGLEYHLDGNHLLENMLALARVCRLGGAGDGSAEDSGRERMRGISGRVFADLLREMDAQILADGGHCELSPMYHSLILEHTLDLLNEWPDDSAYFPEARARLAETANRMLAWLKAMSVGGEYALFNDCAYDPAPRADALIAYGERLLGRRQADPGALTCLPDSGYYRARSGPWTVLFDGGRLGPDYQMGHVHCDMLSFCLWCGDSPLVVHPGTFEYQEGLMRDQGRATASHNTVSVDGQEQAELWGAHRVGRRGVPASASAEHDPARGVIRLAGGHWGFAHLPGKPFHERILEISDSGVLIRDSIRSGREHDNRAFIHLHPDCTVEVEGTSAWVRLGTQRFVFRGRTPPRVGEGWYCPEFGVRRLNRVLSWDFRKETCEVAIAAIPC